MCDKKNMEVPFLSESRKRELLLFQETLGLNFNNLNLLNNALTHSSYINEYKSGRIADNERLEFLGDSVLSLSVSDWLYNNISANEGSYSKIRCVVVSEDTLCKVALKLGLDKYILLGHGEETSGGRRKKAVLADATEALFASVYLDKGFYDAKSFILKYLVPEIKLVVENSAKKDFKTMLQEYVQRRYKTVPEYILKGKSGPEHDPEFSYIVTFGNKTYGPVFGHSKKESEQKAAEAAWSAINDTEKNQSIVKKDYS